MILNSDPRLNEPGQGELYPSSSPEGRRLSMEYNANIRENTMKFAMLEMLLQPTPAMQDIVCNHFRINKDEVLRVCDEWVKEATPAEKQASLRDLRNRISAELDKL